MAVQNNTTCYVSLRWRTPSNFWQDYVLAIMAERQPCENSSNISRMRLTILIQPHKSSAIFSVKLMTSIIFPVFPDQLCQCLEASDIRARRGLEVWHGTQWAYSVQEHSDVTWLSFAKYTQRACATPLCVCWIQVRVNWLDMTVVLATDWASVCSFFFSSTNQQHWWLGF